MRILPWRDHNGPVQAVHQLSMAVCVVEVDTCIVRLPSVQVGSAWTDRSLRHTWHTICPWRLLLAYPMEMYRRVFPQVVANKEFNIVAFVGI